MIEEISEIELQAYIDGELETARRIAVEAYLEAHPEMAARVMRDMRLRDEIRLFVSESDDQVPARTEAVMRRLSARYRLRAAVPILRNMAAAVALLVLGWFAHDYAVPGDQQRAYTIAQISTLIDEAAEAHLAALTELASAHPYILDEPQVLAEKVLISEEGVMPSFPSLDALLDIVGSELVPWDGGIAVQVIYRDPGGHAVTLFAARVEPSENLPPTATSLDGLTLVHWQDGPYAFALSGDLPATDLMGLARGAGRPDRS
jgi:anti-sigma factor RsiW